MKIYKKKEKKRISKISAFELYFYIILYYIFPFLFHFRFMVVFFANNKKNNYNFNLVDFKYQPNNQNHNNFVHSLLRRRKKGAMTKRWGKKQYKYVYMCIYHRRFYLFLKFQYFFSIYLYVVVDDFILVLLVYLPESNRHDLN